MYYFKILDRKSFGMIIFLWVKNALEQLLKIPDSWGLFLWNNMRLWFWRVFSEILTNSRSIITEFSKDFGKNNLLNYFSEIYNDLEEVWYTKLRFLDIFRELIRLLQCENQMDRKLGLIKTIKFDEKWLHHLIDYLTINVQYSNIV